MNGHPTGTFRQPSANQPRITTQRALLLALFVVAALFAGSSAARPTWADETTEYTPNNSYAPTSDELSVETETIVDVQVRGNDTIQFSDIASHIKTRPGRVLDNETRMQIREDINSLYATRWFVSIEKSVRETEKGLILIYQVHERPMVNSVKYVGNKRIKDKKLAAITNIKKGSPVDASINRDAARRLQQEYFNRGFIHATVDLEKGGNKEDREVVFRIVEGEKTALKGIKFIGNDAFSSSLLATKLTLKPWVPHLLGKKFDPAVVPDEVTILRNYYQALGYFDVQIDYKIGFSENKKKAYIEYTIEEGRLYRIGEIVFVGNKIYDHAALSHDIALHTGDDFNLRTLNKDISVIHDKYYELGHFFSTVEATPRFLEKEGIVDLVYRIDEDEPKVVRRINVHLQGDNPHTKQAVVRNYMKLHPGDLANRRLIDRSKSTLGGVQMFERGPQNGIEINVTPVTPVGAQMAAFRGQNESTQPLWSATPTSNIFSNPGQSLTKRDRLHRLLAGNPTNVSTRSNSVVATRQNVTRTNHAQTTTARATQRVKNETSPFMEAGTEDPWFVPQGLMLAEAVKAPVIRGQNYEGGIPQPGNPLFPNNPQGDPYAPTPSTAPPGFVDLDVYATEARTGRIMFGVGVNSDAGVVGSIVLSEQNFDLFRPPRSFQDIIDGTAWRGGGQRFRAEAVPGSEVSRYLVSWTDPFFMNTDYSLSLSGFYFTRFYDDWDEQRAGGRVQVGRQLTQEWSVSGGFRIEGVDVSDVDVPTPKDLADVEGSNLLTTLLFSVAHDTRDAPFLTGEGHLVSLNFEQAVGEFNYSRVGLEGSQYYTLFSRPDGGGRHILALSGQLGWTGSDTPIFERYFAGGFQTFRGFEFRGVSPRELGVRVGGEWLALASAEYMFPLMANETFQGVVFSDMGTVEPNAGFDNFRLSVGAGLRVTIPAMGPVPLAFDFAVPILKEDFDDEQIFSFYVGVTR